MSFALSAGVTGLQAHQKMLDVAGNNLANVNTTAFKASRITFSELLCETIKKASAPTTTIGGTNPQQMGSGVGVAGIVPNMVQGNLVNTGNPLDLAIEGEGYFVLNGPEGDIYSRAGAFAVDADSNLVDPTTGYLVQRIGTVGESDNFQTSGVSKIRVPYDVTMVANATSQITVAGNVSADATFATTQTQKLTSDTGFTTGSGTVATSTTVIGDLDQYTGSLTSGTISYTGYNTAGTSLSALTTLPTVALAQSVDSTTTLDDILTKLNGSGGSTETSELQTLTADGLATGGTFTLTYNGQTTAAIAFDATTAQIQTALNALSTVGTDEIVVGGTGLDTAGTTTFTFDDEAGDVAMIGFDFSSLTGDTTQAGSSIAETTPGVAIGGILSSFATASLSAGKIVITESTSGYSRSDFDMAWSGDGTLTMPAFFELTTVGGEEVKNVSITIYDSQGGKHVLSGAFVRTGTANTWDMVLTSITGNINDITFDNRRIRSIEFDPTNGSYSGLNATIGDTAEFVVSYAFDPSNPQTVAVSMGTMGQLDGLTQFAGNSTAVARDQDGYEAGRLSTVSVDNEGTVIGAFSNGVKRDIATIQIALFQNPAALESAGSGYFSTSANSGVAVATQAMTGGAGTIHGGALEKSNADVATEFVNMIQAQNGFQANARTIRVANDILRELTTLIR
ncbi:MAG: flagellar hook-basal body complex protein [Planctomycetota bacterium]|jgi:flagellar hook protein FlgE